MQHQKLVHAIKMLLFARKINQTSNSPTIPRQPARHESASVRSNKRACKQGDHKRRETGKLRDKRAATGGRGETSGGRAWAPPSSLAPAGTGRAGPTRWWRGAASPTPSPARIASPVPIPGGWGGFAGGGWFSVRRIHTAMGRGDLGLERREKRNGGRRRRERECVRVINPSKALMELKGDFYATFFFIFFLLIELSKLFYLCQLNSSINYR